MHPQQWHMSARLNIILIVFFIFFVNSASAVEHNYVALTLAPGEEVSRTTSFTGTYKPLFAAVDASGTALSWVIPRHIDFGPIDPGDKVVRDYTISVPTYQKPGYYELIWTFSCRYTDESACTVTSDTVLQITVQAAPTPTATETQYLTIIQGREASQSLSFTATGSYQLYSWADASGSASSWVTPTRVNFGAIGPGGTVKKYYTIKVPDNQRPGYYELIWTYGCRISGQTCTVTDPTVLQIIVEEAPVPTYTYEPVYTPPPESSTSSEIIGFIFILVLFIFWVYIVVWVARDANKRGTSGTAWGFLAFFTGLIGLLVYFAARPKGNLVLCDSCRKEKLETLDMCPHCKMSAQVKPKPVSYHAMPQKPGPVVNDLKGLKEKLGKINVLLDKLDERLAQGEITESKYKELSEKYRAEADNLKNQIAEKELLDEVGLKKGYT